MHGVRGVYISINIPHTGAYRGQGNASCIADSTGLRATRKTAAQTGGQRAVRLVVFGPLVDPGADDFYLFRAQGQAASLGQ